MCTHNVYVPRPFSNTQQLNRPVECTQGTYSSVYLAGSSLPLIGLLERPNKRACIHRPPRSSCTTPRVHRNLHCCRFGRADDSLTDALRSNLTRLIAYAKSADPGLQRQVAEKLANEAVKRACVCVQIGYSAQQCFVLVASILRSCCLYFVLT